MFYNILRLASSVAWIKPLHSSRRRAISSYRNTASHSLYIRARNFYTLLYLLGEVWWSWRGKPGDGEVSAKLGIRTYSKKIISARHRHAYILAYLAGWTGAGKGWFPWSYYNNCMLANHPRDRVFFCLILIFAIIVRSIQLLYLVGPRSSSERGARFLFFFTSSLPLPTAAS